MKIQLLIVLLCAAVFTTGVHAMFGKFGNPTAPTAQTARSSTAFRRASFPATTTQRSPVTTGQTTAFRRTTRPAQTRVTPVSRIQPHHTVGAPERLPVQPGASRAMPMSSVATTGIATTPKTSGFSLGSAQQAFSSVSSAPGVSSVLPEGGVSKISEGMSSASSFQGLKQTTGSTAPAAPAAAQNVMQGAPATATTALKPNVVQSTMVNTPQVSSLQTPAENIPLSDKKPSTIGPRPVPVNNPAMPSSMSAVTQAGTSSDSSNVFQGGVLGQ